MDTDHASLAAFNYRMSIDWLSIRVKLNETTRGDVVKRAFESLGVTYAVPNDLREGNAATDFSIRLQNPTRLAQITRLLAKMNEWNSIVGEPVIDGIEISFDAFSNTSSEAALDAMRERMIRQSLPPIIHSSARVVGADRSQRELLSPIKCKVPINTTFYLGDWSKSNSLPEIGVAFRAYKKLHDNKISLAPELRSARFEAVIAGPKLLQYGLTSLDQLGGYRFELLADLFRFAAPIPGRLTEHYQANTDMVSFYFQHRGADENAPCAILNHLARKDSRGRPLVKSRFLKIDAAMTGIARDQLRKLSLRFSPQLRRCQQTQVRPTVGFLRQADELSQ